jgi:hypothetical protein
MCFDLKGTLYFILENFVKFYLDPYLLSSKEHDPAKHSPKRFDPDHEVNADRNYCRISYLKKKALLYSLCWTPLYEIQKESRLHR